MTIDEVFSLSSEKMSEGIAKAERDEYDSDDEPFTTTNYKKIFSQLD